MNAFQKEQQEIKELREAGVLGPQIARRIMNMVNKLHQDGYESLYLDSQMAPSGGFWRYEIGAMEKGGLWPNRNCDFNKVEFCIKDSIGGRGLDQRIPWATVTDSVDILASKFQATYPKLVEAARQSNTEYVNWFREMIDRTKPEGTLIFCCDLGPDHEYAFTWGAPEIKMPMPPGYRKRNT
ncbi:Uncharacterised protein [uncultured archaeon]|nr:Uncharacterised protein [uncultured archaeon]